jgi:hypothetical protein
MPAFFAALLGTSAKGLISHQGVVRSNPGPGGRKFLRCLLRKVTNVRVGS